MSRTIDAAVEAVRLGYQPVPIHRANKRPYGAAWNQKRWEDSERGHEALRAYFEEAEEKDAPGIGLLLGKQSGGLVDVDLDHPLALQLRDHFLPPSAMETGRAGRPLSHRWYQVEDPEQIPPSRPYKMPDGSTCIEVRSSGEQTVIPPSIHPSGEPYLWEGEPWGGESGPARVPGNALSVQVALLSMAAILVEHWPKAGGRHDAYLALAGGLLRYGDTVHVWWERNIGILISGLADVTHDEDGPETRIAEAVNSTARRIRDGRPVGGFPKLAEIIGDDHAEMVRRRAREVESLAGFVPEQVQHLGTPTPPEEDDPRDRVIESTLPPEDRNPLEERQSSWEAVDIWPYLTGQVTMPEPSVLRRSDGKGLLYPGRVNMIYGKSESAKSWISLYACIQEMSVGERVMYLDFEDEPVGTLARMQALGAGNDDLTKLFRYVHPESPLAAMQRNRFGGSQVSEDGRTSESAFRALLEEFDPTLIVADGMTVLYGLHGLDTNDAMATDVITGWLKSLTRGSRTTVIVIDHTGKGGGPGSSPIGAHHKVAMIQGTALRADAITRPMPGRIGKVNLVVYKDRPGSVRAISTNNGTKEQVAAELTMDSTEEGVTRMLLEPGDPGNVVIGDDPDSERKLGELARAEEMRDKVLDMFEGDMDRRIKTPEVVKALDMTQGEVYETWGLLIRSGLVIREGKTSATRFRLRDPIHDDNP